MLDLGDAKPAREYDDFVRAALADIQLWWSEQFPALYDAPYEPLAGGVYAAYPERTTPIPGCGTSEPTPYEEIIQYSAFYCMQGDFMVYDDGEAGAARTGWRRSSDSRSSVWSSPTSSAMPSRRAPATSTATWPTITTEQQADCFAGAWVARAARGEAVGITFSDAEVRTGLIAMIAVRDPVGIDQFSAGGHGSAFDRVGAFQVGFSRGPARCAELIDDPLPLVPNTFRDRRAIRTAMPRSATRKMRSSGSSRTT